MRSNYYGWAIGGLIGLSLCGLPGCGGGTSSTGGVSGFSSGFGKNQELSTLSPEQGRELCNRAVAFFENDFTDENICRIFAVAEAASSTPVGSEASCVAQTNACAQAPSTTEILGLDCSTNPPRSTVCPLAVEVYENCINETAEQFRNIAEEADCSAPTIKVVDDFLQFFGTETPQTPNCLELKQKCPSLFFENHVS